MFLLHTDVRCLQLHEELKVFSSDDSCARLACLADRFQHLNDLKIECKAEIKTSSQVQTKYADFIQQCSSGDNMWKVPTSKCSHTPRNGRKSIVLQCARQ